MDYYFENVLKGFKTEESQVRLGEYTRMDPHFLLIDVDQDGMPEIIFVFRYDREKYVGVLKRQNMLWRLYNVSNERMGNENGVFTLLNSCDEVCITPRDMGKVMVLKDICPEKGNYFIGLIDDKLYYGEVVSVEEPIEQKKNNILMRT